VHACLAVSVEVTNPTRDFGMHTCSQFIQGTYSPSQLCRRHHARNRGFCRKTQPTTAQHATVSAQPRSTNGQLSPHQKIAKAFAPATIANLGPGFDWMGCAVEVCLKLKSNTRLPRPRRPYGVAALYQLVVVLSPKYAHHSLYKQFDLYEQFDFLQGEGDVVIAEAMPDLPGGEVVIKSITGDDGRLPLVAANNCVGIAAIETIKLLGNIDCGVALTLLKVSCTPTLLPAVIKIQPGILASLLSDGAGLLMHAYLQSVPHVSTNNMLQPQTESFHRSVQQPCHHVCHCSKSSILYMCISVMLQIIYTYSTQHLRTGLSQAECYEFMLHLSLLSRAVA